jgi:hypothetical protein
MQRERLPALIAVIGTLMLTIGLFIFKNTQKQSPNPPEKTREATTNSLDKPGNSQGTLGSEWIKPICPTPALMGKVASSPTLMFQQNAQNQGVPSLPIPSLWIEFILPSPSFQKPKQPQISEFITVQFSSQTTEQLNNYWEVFCNYYFKIGKIKEPEAKKDLMGELMYARGNFADSLQKAQINAPDGKRCICEEEAWEIVNLLTLSAQQAMSQYLDDTTVGKLFV